MADQLTPDNLLALPEEELNSKFEDAVKQVREGPANPNTSMSDKLKVYGLFKQATIGDNETTAPWAVQLEAKSKWDAWTANKGKSQKQAKAEYIANIKK
mmetsp:Transcript_9911/g.12353  ORF Transcript_9911/g.12353 Transcript_9911/m.12353 type:complete len:99 (+) Transcript_9911:264-560(+)